MSNEIIRSVAYDNYDDFQHINLILFFWNFISTPKVSFQLLQMSPLHYINVYILTHGDKAFCTWLSLYWASNRLASHHLPPSLSPSPFLFHISQDVGMAIFSSEWSSTCKNILGFWVKEPNTTNQCFFFLGKYSHFFKVENKRGFLCKKLPLIHQSLEKKKTNKICITRFLQQIPAGSQTIKEFCNFFLLLYLDL